MLAELARDGRTGVVALAKATGWPQSRVSARLEELLSAGALHIAVDLAPAQFGFHAIATSGSPTSSTPGATAGGGATGCSSDGAPASRPDSDLPRPSTTS